MGTGQSSESMRKTSLEDTSPPQAKGERTVTIHPRIALIEDHIVENLSQQIHVPETTIWGISASDGLLLQLIKHGPNEEGLYGGRWSAKELAQIIRRRFITLLFDFQYEQGELPGILHDHIATLKSLAERAGVAMIPSTTAVPQTDVMQATAEDDLIFGAGGDAESFTNSLGGMGFSLLEHSNDAS